VCYREFMDAKDIFFLVQWSARKIMLASAKSRIVFKEGEVWWCHIGFNLGEEIYGKGSNFMRPVLVFKKFTYNSFLALPVTTKCKFGSWYVQIEVMGTKRTVLLNQARTVDRKRLQRKIGNINEDDWLKINDEFASLYVKKIITSPLHPNDDVSRRGSMGKPNMDKS
jgi:mRNA-degrading endonuclease toxin of MazEF toxin-antitoxin module